MIRNTLLAVVLGGVLTSEASAQPPEKLYGYYVGDFMASKMDNQKHPMYVNKINLAVDRVDNNTIQGHSVVAGNKRPFKGTIVKKNGRYQVEAREPGDNQYDGTFKFVLDPTAHTVTGTWTANDRKLAASARKYTLKKTVFRYDPHLALGPKILERGHGTRRVYDGQTQDRGHKSESLTLDAGKFNASVTALRSRDVENLYKRDLEVMRNAIYARHGYSFQNREMRFFFDRVPWYIPVSIDVTADLTDLERANIELLKRYENHATAYYDRFGR